MNHYLVKLDLMIEGNEKTSVNLVGADTPAEAGRQALINEAHNKIGEAETHQAWWEGDDTLHDFDGNMVYTVCKVTPIDEATYQAIKSAF
jgi:hypothetical protein